MVENLPVMQETQILSLGWKDPLEKEVATHSSSLAQEIPWTEEPGGLQYAGSQNSGSLLRDYKNNICLDCHTTNFVSNYST